MIHARRHVSVVATSRPWPRTRLARRQLQPLNIRHFAQSKTTATIEDDGDTHSRPSAKKTIYCTETPVSQQLDSIGLYTRSTLWQTVMQSRWEKDATKFKPVQAQTSTKGTDGTKAKSSSRLVALRALLKSTEKSATWKRILDEERVYRKGINNLKPGQALPKKYIEDRPPRVIEIVSQALEKSNAGTLTLEDRSQMEAELEQLIPPRAKISEPTANPWIPRPVMGDKSRVHIVDERLCDDVLKYIPSLERHKGCDIIDMYPGAGLFSRKLNDLLQPRSHILLEPEPKLYTSFLEPLLQRPGVKLIPKAGIVWEHLNSILTPEFLPHQKEVDRFPIETPPQNDTLLVVANLGFFPSKSYQGFKSIVSMLLFQFIAAIKLRNLFQKYGRVRMLLWVKPEEAAALVPQRLSNRGRIAVEAEVTTEYVAQICSADIDSVEEGLRRERHISLGLISARQTLERMRKAGIQIPEGRKTSFFMNGVMAAEAAGHDLPLPGKDLSEDLARLLGCEPMGHIPAGATPNTILSLEASNRRQQNLLVIREQAERLVLGLRETRAKLANTETPDPGLVDEVQQLQEQIESTVVQLEELLSELPLYYSKYLSEVRALASDPPVLSWDRRPVEPLVAQPNEFYPNVPLSLVDIQPRAMPERLLQLGKNSTRSGDHFELLMAAMTLQRSTPIEKLLGELTHGADEGVDLKNIESFNDPRLGGSVMHGADKITPSVMNLRQFEDLLDAWMKWPFRPSYTELVTRVRDTPQDEEV